MDTIWTIDRHITAIDHGLMGQAGVGVVYVVRGDDVALIDSGTSLTVEATLAGLDTLQIPRDAVRYIICTHVHMDHAGGAGYLIDALPHATVAIHSRSIKHLLDPTRLREGVRRAVGEERWPLYGEMRPIPAERVVPADTQSFDLGRGICLSPIPAPGHSPDHLAFHDSLSGGIFVGDATSMSLPHYNLHLPSAPAPSYDLDAHYATIARIRDCDASSLLITHCGVCNDPPWLLQFADEQLGILAELVQDALAKGQDEVSAIAARWMPRTGPDSIKNWLQKNMSETSVRGMLHYYRQRQMS